MAANFETRQRRSARQAQARPDPGDGRRDLAARTVGAHRSAKIAGAAGHTAASINFHFGSKKRCCSRRCARCRKNLPALCSACAEEAGEDDPRRCLGIVDASLGRDLSDSHKIAVWYAFLAESSARGDYQRICGERDAAWSRMVIDLCKRIISARGNGAWPDAEAVAQGLTGLIDQQWQGILFEGDDFDREAARRQCRAYLLQRLSVARAAHRGAARPRARRRDRASSSRRTRPSG